MAATLIPDSIRNVLSYDPATGVFRWKVARPNGIKPGDAVYMGRHGNGYLVIKLRNKKWLAHRLAWFLAHNEQPEVIDHINHDKTDNRLRNLRSVSHTANSLNKTIPGGVSWKWYTVKKRSGRKYRYRCAVATYRSRHLYGGKSILLAHYHRIMAERADHPIGLPTHPSSGR